MKEEKEKFDISDIGDAPAELTLTPPEEEISEEEISEEGNPEDASQKDSENDKEDSKDEKSEEMKSEGDSEESSEESSEDEDSEENSGQMSLAASFILAAAKILSGEASEEDYLNLKDMIAAREAVANAFAEGELKGRNTIIEEELVEIPSVPDLGGAPLSPARSGNSIFDLASLAK